MREDPEPEDEGITIDLFQLTDGGILEASIASGGDSVLWSLLLQEEQDDEDDSVEDAPKKDEQKPSK